MKKKKMILAMLVSMAMFVLTIAANLIVTASKTDEDALVWATEVKKSSYDGVAIKTKAAEEELYNMAVHYPVFSIAALDEQIEQYVKTKESQFFSEMDAMSDDALVEHSASFSLTFRLISAGEGFYSIIFMVDSYTGNGSHKISKDTLMADVIAKKFVAGRELFINPDKAARALITPVQNSLPQGDHLSEDIAHSFAGDQALANIFIEENDVVFPIKSGETMDARMPIKKIKPYMKKEWRDRFAVSMTNEQLQAPDAPPKTAVEARHIHVKKVALTFDDGPNPDSTTAILSVLKKYDAKATFYVLGSRVDFFPELVERMAQEGHEIGNHSWSHKDFTKIPPSSVQKELDMTAAAVEKAAGVSPLTVRPPYGATNKNVNQILGAPPILWSVDTLDWKSHNPKSIYNIVKQNAKDGSIILMHDIHKTTADALEEIIIYLQNQGYELVTVDELY
ncbi:polysaccharide deacetylase family protein [Domibacillus epiphyticus]|uniref:NodB homology domain-containing protein n=1 Tax=Domibacillus epiphyticus TaxID=1714355 RepID=A0A1V2A6V5_9BACI|nr:polysaccharide deacetylase family protein [Domibacillus epiphyticus]OMP66735.1 hypothetical protein BTO28_10565 [Domibacillus epiphyticus]